MFHWCQDETNAVLMSVPFLGYYFVKFKVWWQTKFGKSKGHCCKAEHANHKD